MIDVEGLYLVPKPCSHPKGFQGFAAKSLESSVDKKQRLLQFSGHSYEVGMRMITNPGDQQAISSTARRYKVEKEALYTAQVLFCFYSTTASQKCCLMCPTTEHGFQLQCYS